MSAYGTSFENTESCWALKLTSDELLHPLFSLAMTYLIWIGCQNLGQEKVFRPWFEMMAAYVKDKRSWEVSGVQSLDLVFTSICSILALHQTRNFRGKYFLIPMNYYQFSLKQRLQFTVISCTVKQPRSLQIEQNLPEILCQRSYWDDFIISFKSCYISSV